MWVGGSWRACLRALISGQRVVWMLCEAHGSWAYGASRKVQGRSVCLTRVVTIERGLSQASGHVH